MDIPDHDTCDEFVNMKAELAERKTVSLERII